MSSPSPPRDDPGGNVVDDFGYRRSRREHAVDPGFQQFRDVGVRDDPAAEDDQPAHPLRLEQFDHPGDQVVVRTRQHGEADGVHVLLGRRVDDHFRGLVKAGVDHLESGVPQRPCDALRPPVVPVQPRLPHEDPELPRRSALPAPHQKTAGSV
jgi:hypothetical protein